MTREFRYGNIFLVNNDMYKNVFLIYDGISKTISNEQINGGNYFSQRLNFRSLDWTSAEGFSYSSKDIKQCITNKFRTGSYVTLKNGIEGTINNKTIQINNEDGSKKLIRLSNYDNSLVNTKDDDYTIMLISVYSFRERAKEVVWNRSIEIPVIQNKIKKLKENVCSYKKK